MRTITDPYEAYWFLYDHPNCVEIDEAHPIVNWDEYAHEGLKVFGTNERVRVREGKPQDAEYRRAVNEHAFPHHWTGQFINNLDIHYAKVNPKTKSVSKQPYKNTQTEVWLETGPAYFDEYSNQYRSNMHDIRLDCGGSTFDEALVSLANLVMKHYGDYERES